ncbi:hypothetical protein [Roseiflexus sp.]|uniref:hypothetical protein n=1 Tax=Roseiflexus sp. TaxID=2562120 RepID=UPI00398BB965
MIRLMHLSTAHALSASRKRAINIGALVLVFYLALALVVTWPLVLHFGDRLFGGIDQIPGRFRFAGDEEAGLHLWHLWWVSEAILRGVNPFWTDLLFYPDGVQLYVQTLSAPNAIIALPVYGLMGPIAAFNTIVLLGFVLTGFGVFLLARRWCSGFWGPLLCGVLVTLSPFHLGQLQNSHNHLFSMQWIPLYMYALVLLDKRGGRWHIGYASVMAALVVLSDWYWASICGVLTVVWLIVRLALVRERWVVVRRYALFAAGAGLTLAPFLAQMIAIRTLLPLGHEGRDKIWEAYIRYSSADLFGLLFPNVYNPLWSAWVEQLLRPIAEPFAPSVWYVAAGWTLTLLAIVGAWFEWKRAVHLVVVGLGMWLIALGPTLFILGYESGIPMLYAWLDWIPLFGAARKPALFVAPVLVIMGILAAMGLNALSRRLPSAWKTAPVVVAALLGTFELWLPQGRVLLPLERSAVYEQIAALPGAVADLPLDVLETSRTLRNQMIHRQPIVGGFIARRPAYDSFNIPLLRAVGSMRALPENDVIPLGQEHLRAMQCYAPVRHVVIRSDVTTWREQHDLEQTITRLIGHAPVPVYEDGQYRRYELPLFSDTCRPFVYLGSGWYNLEISEAGVYRWGSANNDIWLANPYNTPVWVTLALALSSYETPRLLEIRHEQRLVGRWEVERAARTYYINVMIPPGQTRLRLSAPASDDPASQSQLSVVMLKARIVYYAPETR